MKSTQAKVRERQSENKAMLLQAMQYLKADPLETCRSGCKAMHWFVISRSTIEYVSGVSKERVKEKSSKQ